MISEKNNADFSLEKRALYEVIADKLETMLLYDTATFREAFPSESFLATAFSVSRPVIREAMKLLKERGLVRTQQGAKTVFTMPCADTVVDSVKRVVSAHGISAAQLYQVRIALETLAVATLAQEHTEEDILKLREANAYLDSIPEADPERLAQADTSFHKTISELCGNYILSVLLLSLAEPLEKTVEEILTLSELKEDAVQFHEKIIEKISKGDVEGASDTMKAHLLASMRNYEFILKKKEETQYVD